MIEKQTLEKITPAATISQITAADKQASQLLESIGLDIAAHKDETLQSVCKQHQWSEKEVLQWLRKDSTIEGLCDRDEEAHLPDFGNDISQWCSYLEEEKMPIIMDLLDQIITVFPRVRQIHGNQYIQLKNISWYFYQLEDRLEKYYDFLLKKFYPAAIEANRQKGHGSANEIEQLRQGLDFVNKNHVEINSLMATIRRKGNNFENPWGADSTLRIMNQNFKMLFKNIEKQFEIEQDKILPGLVQIINNE
ncbi:MAG TPA: hypothetical protein VE868_06395 [Balneolaceae bacterium]|nr:hypothetical protein [Balneolaceae bacterium]